MNKTSIQWTDFTSNPIRYKNADGLDVWACSKVSAGCTNCYAETLALSPRMVSKGRALGAKFNDAEMAKLTPYVDDAELAAILRMKSAAGKRVFLGDMTDIFGPWVTDEMLDRVFAVMALRPDVTFQILTKRPERMREYLSDQGLPERIDAAMEEESTWGHVLSGFMCLVQFGEVDRTRWPLPNVWLGTSVEDQEAADKRIPELLATPAAMRFLSCEPLLGPVDLTAFLRPPCDCVQQWDASTLHAIGCSRAPEKARRKWIISGGESGPKARACDVAWIRDLKAQCEAAGVAVFVKQLGSKPLMNEMEMWERDGRSWETLEPRDALAQMKLRDRHGGNPEEWPADLRVREFPQ